MNDRIDLEALHYYLSYKYVPSPHTIYQGKQKQPLFDSSSLQFSPVLELAESQIIDRLDILFQQAVKNVLSDQPAIFLSGGIDSALIAAVASRLTERRIQTFNLVFAPDIETDKKRKDKEYARQLVVQFGTRHREGLLTLKSFQTGLPSVLQIIGEPYACNMSMYFICEFAREYVNTVIAGDWADELFGSYEDHKQAALHPEQAPSQIRYAASIFSDEDKQELYSEMIRQKAQAYSTREHLKHYFQNLSARDPVNRMLEGWFRSVFPDNTLMPVIKLSRAHGIEVRSPYADPELVDFVTKIPGHLKIREGETKYIMKQLALRYLPEKFVFREKEFFTPPLLSLATASESYIRSILSPVRLKKHGYFKEEYVAKLLDTFFKQPTEPLSYKIWTLAAFQVWYDVNAD